MSTYAFGHIQGGHARALALISKSRPRTPHARLVFVGDPRQLPPIGAGRPFADLLNDVRPDVFDEQARVGPSYVALRVPLPRAAEHAPGAQTTAAGPRAPLASSARSGAGARARRAGGARASGWRPASGPG